MARAKAKVNWRLSAGLAYTARMTPRLFKLYLIGIKSFFHRLRHDLGRELTVLIASLVLFATFSYVFNDFLNVQVRSLSLRMREAGGLAATLVVLLVATISSARFLRGERVGEQTLRRWSTAIGEERANVLGYLVLRFATVLALLHGVAWYVVERWLFRMSALQASLTELVALGLTAGLSLLPEGAETKIRRRTARPPKSITAALTTWRWRQMLTRNRATRTALVSTLPFVALAALAGARGAPLFVAVVAGLICGILAASTLSFQVAEDLANAWVERGFGVSHDQFVKSYQWLGARLGGSTFAVLALAYAAASWSHGAEGLALLLDAAKVGAVAAVPPLVAPVLLLQIDGRRPAINVLMTVIAGLFVGTAVFAHWLGLALIPVLHYSALQSQAGRFYRA